ncbi:MAG: hypothetical protein ACJ77K_05300 [Bacteroidia bacterium]
MDEKIIALFRGAEIAGIYVGALIGLRLLIRLTGSFDSLLCNKCGGSMRKYRRSRITKLLGHLTFNMLAVRKTKCKSCHSRNLLLVNS